MTINLNTNVDDTKEFQRLLRVKTIEGALRFLKKAIEDKAVKVSAEVIKQTDDYSKDAKLLIKGIRFL